MKNHPATERKNAARAIVRFKGAKGAAEEESPIEVTEDWVRLYVALRRASGSSAVRFSAAHLRRWRARVCRACADRALPCMWRACALGPCILTDWLSILETWA